MNVLALVICTIVVLFLLRLDHKQYPSASLSLWIPTIWFLIITSKPLGIWFGIVGENVEDGSVVDRVVLIVLLCFAFIIVKKRNVKIISSLQHNPSIILLMGFMLISIFWSDIPFVSFKRWVRNIIPILMALIIASENDPSQSLQCLFRRMIYIHIPYSYMVIHFYSDLGRQYGRFEGELMWIGVSTQKNGLAFICMFALFYFAWTFIRRRQGRDSPVVWYQPYIEMFIVFLTFYLFMGPNRTLNYSATALALLIIGVISVVGLLWLKKNNIFLSANILSILITSVIIYGTVTPFIGGLVLFDPSAVLGRDESLTGRSNIWANLVPYAIQKPILGYGYGGFWTNLMIEKYVGPAHNGYLQVILDTGLVGLLILSIFLISNCRKARELMGRDLDMGIFWFCIIFIAVIRNISESAVTCLADTLPAILLFMLISYSSKLSKQTATIKEEPSLASHQ